MQVRNKVIWVWPDSSPQAVAESTLTEVSLCPEALDLQDGEPHSLSYPTTFAMSMLTATPS